MPTWFIFGSKYKIYVKGETKLHLGSNIELFIIGNRTPNYIGARTPSHDPSRTPSHDPSRTPSHVGHGGAWDPTQPNTPARPSDEFDNYSFDGGAGPSPVSIYVTIKDKTGLYKDMT